MKYIGEEDLLKLKELISYYLDSVNGNYGFLEGEKFYNRKDIEATFKDRDRRERYFQHSEDIFSGRLVDTKVILRLGTDLYPMFKNAISVNKHFPFEEYTFHFLYDKGQDEVTMRIEARYHYVDEVTKFYYQIDGNEEDEKDFEQKKVRLQEYQVTVYQIAPRIEMRGPMSKLLEEAGKLVQVL